LLNNLYVCLNVVVLKRVVLRIDSLGCDLHGCQKM